MLLREYAMQVLGRTWPSTVELDRATFGPHYTGISLTGHSIEFAGLEPLLDVVATEFARGVQFTTAPAFTGVPGDRILVLRRGWRPCNIDVIRNWVIMYNLTQSWDHVDGADLDGSPAKEIPT